MHKFLLLFLCVTVLNVHGKPQVKSDKDALIEKFVQKETDRGKYYRFRTSNGIEQEQVFLIKDADNNDIFEIQGQYSYTAPNGDEVVVRYKADKNGFRIIQPEDLTSRIGTTVLESLIGGGVG